MTNGGDTDYRLKGGVGRGGDGATSAACLCLSCNFDPCPDILLLIARTCHNTEASPNSERKQERREKRKERRKERRKDNAYRGSWQTLPSNLDRHLSSPMPPSSPSPSPPLSHQFAVIRVRARQGMNLKINAAH